MKVDLTGRVVLVRGMAGRFGRAVADRVTASGGHVVEHAGAADGAALYALVNADPALLDGDGVPAEAAGAAMASCEAAASVMAAGRIVNVASVFGLVPRRGSGGLSAACAALFAQTRAMALDLAPRGVLVNAVAVLTEDRAHTPLARAAQPGDVAQAVLFLLAAASSYVVGETLRVDGGWSVGYAREF